MLHRRDRLVEPRRWWTLPLIAGLLAAALAAAGAPGVVAADEAVSGNDGVVVEIFEELAGEASWQTLGDQPSERFEQPAMALVAVPRKYNAKALIVDRPMPYLLRMAARIERPAGEYRLLLRSRDAARLKLDGRVVAQTRSISPNASGHEHVPDLKPVEQPGLRPLPAGDQEQVVTVKLNGKPHVLSLETLLGSKKLRPETGELLVAIAGEGKPFCLLSPASAVELRDDAWHQYVAEQQRWLFDYERRRRREVDSEEADYWLRRHELARQHWADKPAVNVPAVSDAMPVSNEIDRFISARLEAARIEPAPLTDDAAFLRRLSLDTVGLIPTPEEIAVFQRDDSSVRRARAIDRLLADPRGADHGTSYWQDVLAENPGILKPELNNTGPFRIWIYQSLVDNKPLDRFATELVMMEGSRNYGGPAGFAMATQNDAPLAAKAHVLAKAFLGVEMGCARCHDAPHHDVTQQQTFNLAAMLARGPQKLPRTSTVPLAEGVRKPAITISLDPGQKIEPHWPFAKLIDEAAPPPGVLRNEKDTRERLAATLTMPANERFAQVLVNRLWKRYLGWGLVEPVDDWEHGEASHPPLLDYLARELVTHDYDARHVARLILNSHTYQRKVIDAPASAPVASQRLFASPARRRMTAEQLVDSLLAAAGKPLGAEQLTLDPDGRRPVSTFLNLGVPRRAWQLTSLSNERDRPALALPRAQGIVDLLVSYGWRDARPDPLTERDTTATPLQPLALAHGAVGTRATRLSDDSALTELALRSKSVEELVEQIFLRVLSRRPSQAERAPFVEILSEGFSDRVVAEVKTDDEREDVRHAVSWSNHLSPEATRIKLDLERAARQGDPPTQRLDAAWRERMEDALWALFNSPEFVFVP